MEPTAQRLKMTYDDLLALPEDGLRHELIDGEHIVSPSPGSAHQLIIGSLYLAIATFLRERPVGVVMLAPFDIVFSPFDVVEPDLIYFSMERFRAVVGEKNATGAPDLAIEVLSPSSRRRDEVVKRRLYERTGVPEYWIVDPELEAVRIYRPAEGRYMRVAELSADQDDNLTTPLLPELTIPLASIFQLP